MRWIVLALIVTAVSPARADRDQMIAGRRELIDAFAKRDVATIKARARLPLHVRQMWFDTAPCKKFSGDKLEIGADQLAELVGCIADLGVQVLDEQAHVAATYGPGAPLWIGTSNDGKQLTVVASFHTVDGTPYVHAEVFAKHVAKFQREIEPDPVLKKRIDHELKLHLEAKVLACTDASGTRLKTVGYDSQATTEPGGEPATLYAEEVDTVVRGWKVTPFMAHGKRVPVCALMTLGYPEYALPSLEPVPADSPYAAAPAPPPPPPPPPPSGPSGAAGDPPQVVAPNVLEATRVMGDKNIVPDDDTKRDIQRSGKTRLIGSFKLCLDRSGNVVQVDRIKSTGFEAYDKKILAAIWRWVYKPFLVDGKPVRVCTAVTFIYDQQPAPPPKQ